MDNKALQNSKNATNIFLNKYFNLILSLVVVLGLIFVYFLFIGPKFSTTRQVIQDNIANQKVLYSQQKKKQNTLKAIAKTYSEIPGSDLQKFNTVLPSAYPQETLFGEFEEIISKGGWILSSVKLVSDDEGGDSSSLKKFAEMTGSDDPRVKSINVALQIQAIDYAGLKTLLKMMEGNLRLFDVVEINFTGESAEIILNTYYYGDAVQEEVLPNPAPGIVIEE